MNDTVPKTLAEAKTLLENKMVEVLAILEAKTSKPMSLYPIVLKPLGKRGGIARRDPLEGNIILINSDMVNDKWWETTVNETLPHEVCHHVAPLIYNRYVHGADRGQGWSHGRAWKQCMRMVGLTPDRCLDLTNEESQELALRVVPRNYGYNCGCMVHYVTKIKHNRMQAGSTRICRRCKNKLVFAGEKI
jgi:predicted SprT family Zn-dependent metalloprotease